MWDEVRVDVVDGMNNDNGNVIVRARSSTIQVSKTSVGSNVGCDYLTRIREQ